MSRFVVGVANLPEFARTCARAVRVFESPLLVIWSYVTRQPPGRTIRLRNGYVIHLSDDPADILTIFLVFAREDYGRVAPGAVVVDIGANIGVFALFAAWSGAREVHAYEPSAASFAVLQKNIVANGLEDRVRAERCAVVGRPSPPVRFPRGSSVMNAIVPDTAPDGEYDVVPTVTLTAIIASLETIDLLKLDCEGAEYDILLNSSASDLRKSSDIRLEYHTGPRDTLIEALRACGFGTRQFMDEGGGGGYLWLTREPQA